MMKLKKKNIFIILIVFFCCISFMNIGYSTSNNDEVELVFCNKSEEYKKWEKLSEEEKKTTIMPYMCDSKTNNSKFHYFSFDLKSSLPSKYDLRNETYAPIMKNQRQTGGCWAFATTTGLETYTNKKLKLNHQYSTRHIEYSSTRNFLNNEINDHGYNRTLGSGGNYYMTSNYLINGYGPISENEMPFENNEDSIALSEIKNKNILVDVNNIILKNGTYGDMCTTSEIEDIKKHILENGAVVTTTYITKSTSYYNSQTAAFFYNGSNSINHAVTIIGWDDNYSKYNFSTINQPKSNGAWIVQNSYGPDFGDKGYYYISYEDVHICDIYMAIDGVDNEIEDNSYIHDKLGYISSMGYKNPSGEMYNYAYGMNVFTKEKGKQELLKEVTFGTNGSGSYKIYYTKGNGSNISINSMTQIGTGRINYEGYVTHKLEEPILLDENVSNFSIVIYYSMDTNTTPVPISTTSAQKYEYITITSGQSYMSLNGTSWYDLSQKASIASIKCFTDNIDSNAYELTINSANITNMNNDVLVSIQTTSKNIDTKELEVIISNSKGKIINPNNITYTKLNNDLKSINITLSNIETDTYTISLYYKNKYIDKISKDIKIDKKLTSSVYTIDQTNLLIYVPPEVSLTEFKYNISNTSSDIYLNNEKISMGNIVTGMLINDYLIIVKGDVTGDGLIKMNDVMKISKYIVESTGMSEKAYQIAADVTKDSSIKMNDVMKISQYIVEGGNL